MRVGKFGAAFMEAQVKLLLGKKYISLKKRFIIVSSWFSKASTEFQELNIPTVLGHVINTSIPGNISI